MIGWERVPPIAGGHEDVERCTGPLCGALVRRSDTGRRETHDREFHAVDKPTAIAEHDLRKRLGLGPDEEVPAGRYGGLWGSILGSGTFLDGDGNPIGGLTDVALGETEREPDLTSTFDLTTPVKAQFEANFEGEIETIANLLGFGYGPMPGLVSVSTYHVAPPYSKPVKRRGLTGKRYRIAKRRYARAVRDWRRGRIPGVRVATHLPSVRVASATTSGRGPYRVQMDVEV